MTTETKGIAIFLRPDVEVHTDPTRVIGRRTTCESAEHPYVESAVMLSDSEFIPSSCLLLWT